MPADRFLSECVLCHRSEAQLDHRQTKENPEFFQNYVFVQTGGKQTMVRIFGLNLPIHGLIIIVHDYDAPRFFTKYLSPIQQHVFSQGTFARAGAANEQVTAW